MSEITFDGFESVFRFSRHEDGFYALLAVHTSANGAIGSIHVAPYASEDLGLNTIFSSARDAAYKSQISDSPFGGGAMVVMGDPANQDPDFWRSVGKVIEHFQTRNKFIGVFGLGIAPSAITAARAETSWIAGLPREAGGGGDPTPFIALGAAAVIRAGLSKLDGDDSLEGKKVCIAGVGHSASIHIWEQLTKLGADVTIAVPNSAIRTELSKSGARVTESALDTPCDILIPCGTNEQLTAEQARSLPCRMVAGIVSRTFIPSRGVQIELDQRRILCLPDFLTGAGGYLNVAAELHPAGYDPVRAAESVEGLYDITRRVLDRAASEGSSVPEAATKIVQEKLRRFNP